MWWVRIPPQVAHFSLEKLSQAGCYVMGGIIIHDMYTQISLLLSSSISCMLAVACDNFTLRVVDTDTRRIVRTFTGHTNRITDMVTLSLSIFTTEVIV